MKFDTHPKSQNFECLSADSESFFWGGGGGISIVVKSRGQLIPIYLQHQFPEKGWFQHSESAFKVCDFGHLIKISKLSPSMAN